MVSEHFRTVDDQPVDMLRTVPGEFLVKFRKSTGVRTAKNTLDSVGATSTRAYRSVPGLHRVTLASGASSADVMALARSNPEVEYVQPNYLVHASGIPDDTRFTEQWALNNTGQVGGAVDADIDAPEAWDITTGSDSVVVAVIDTGVRYIHPDLVANMWRNEPECTANGIDDDGNGYADDCHGIDTANGDSDPIDDNNHGTHVAGIIGATGNNAQGISGVARNVKILACKALDVGGSGSTADLIQCLDYIADLKSRGVNIVATNNSYGAFFPDRALMTRSRRNSRRASCSLQRPATPAGTAIR